MKNSIKKINARFEKQSVNRLINIIVGGIIAMYLTYMFYVAQF